MQINTYVNDDYAGLDVRDYEFYYGYEVTENDEEDGDWCFRAKLGDYVITTIPRTHIEMEAGIEPGSEPVRYLLGGIGMLLENNELKPV